MKGFLDNTIAMFDKKTFASYKPIQIASRSFSSN